MMQIAERKQRLTDFIEAVWNQGDSAAAGDYVAAQYTIHHDPGDPWEGMTLDLAGYQDRVCKSRAAFPDQRFQIQGLFGDGHELAMSWLWSATHQGDLPGFPATGREIRMSGATVYFFDTGERLTGHWQIADRLGVYQQLQSNLISVSRT